MNNYENEEAHVSISLKPSTIADFENNYKLMVHNISTHLEDHMKGFTEESQLAAMKGFSSYMTSFYPKYFRDLIRQIEAFMNSFQEMESMRGHYVMKFGDYDKWKEVKVQEMQFIQKKFVIMMREISRELKRLENNKIKPITETIKDL